MIIQAMEKFQWESMEICNYLKVQHSTFQDYDFQFFQVELDKKFGCSWHVVAGEELGFDVDFEVRLQWKDIYILSDSKWRRFKFGV